MFNEQQELDQVIEKIKPFAQIKTLSEVKYKGETFPIYGIVIGSKEKTCPSFGLFGGVHGLEKIGSRLIINYLDYLADQLTWNPKTKEQYDSNRLVCIPIVNPVGMYLGRRSNGNGVDIIRNGPTLAGTEKGKILVSGHRQGPWLPWFRGFDEGVLELETETLIQFVKEELFSCDVSQSLDIHSGFGWVDRLWYPYSKTTEKFPYFYQAMNMKGLIDKSVPYHMYKIEAQSDSYTINGDPWDYLLDYHYNEFNNKKVYIPWTMEIGSWIWVKKNPRQIFNLNGIFNPIKPHRFKRVMRRHRYLLDFMQQSTIYHKTWSTA